MGFHQKHVRRFPVTIPVYYVLNTKQKPTTRTKIYGKSSTTRLLSRLETQFSRKRRRRSHSLPSRRRNVNNFVKSLFGLYGGRRDEATMARGQERDAKFEFHVPPPDI